MISTKGYGFSVEDIDWSSPADMEPYIKAHDEELKEKDYLMWLQGQYFVYALDATVCNSVFWRKKHENPHEYIKNPILQKETEENGNSESKEEVAVFEMKQRIKVLRSEGLPESPV